jgi:hypothetical protein
LTTINPRPRLSLFGGAPARDEDTRPASTRPTMSEESIAALRASFSDKRAKARRSVHVVS